MNRTTTMGSLLLGTALSLPLATTAIAQSIGNISSDELARKSEECQTLAVDYRGMDDPSQIPQEEVVSAIEQDASEQCVQLQDRIAAASGQGGTAQQGQTETQQDQTETQQSETEAATESVDLSEEATLEGEAVVTVPKPDVNVDVPPPNVQVTQQPPEVSVTQQPTDLQVAQESPQIAVEIPEIIVRVNIPAPEFYLLRPDPNVSVSQPDPQVQVRQGDPSVSVTQSDPELNLDLSAEEAAAQAEQAAAEGGSGQAEDGSGLSMQREVNTSGGNAQVEVTEAQGQPQVSTSLSGEPSLSYQAPEPEVTVTMAEQPTVQIEQTGEPTITLETPQEREQRLQQEQQQQQNAQQDAQQQNAQQQQTAQQEQAAQESPGAADQAQSGASGGWTVGELMDMEVVTANGENLGSPEAFVDLNGETNMVLSSGGFLGLGAKQVPVPVSRVSVQGDQLMLDSLSQEEIEAADDFQYDSNAELPEDQQVSLGG